VDVLFAIREVAGTSILVVEGEVDLYTAPRLRCRMTALLEAGWRDLVIDLRSVSFIDSSGLGALVQCRALAERLGTSVSLVCTQPHLLKILRLTGLDQVFALHADPESAAA